MKYGDIIKLNGILGKVVTGDKKFYFHPINYGNYYCSDLEEITDDTIEQTTNEEKIKFIEDTYVWGSVVKTHCIGEYQIIEYLDRNNEVSYNPYINFEDNGCSYSSLDAALIGVIARNKIEVNSANHAIGFIFKM
jgi:hypothetical protein